MSGEQQTSWLKRRKLAVQGGALVAVMVLAAVIYVAAEASRDNLVLLGLVIMALTMVTAMWVS